MSMRELIIQLSLLVKVIIVAGLLGPTIYGTFGIVLLVILLLEQLTQPGIQMALIHKQNKQQFYDTAWTLRVVRGMLLFCAVIISQNWIADLFHLHDFKLVIGIVATSLLLEGFINIGTVEFRKGLDFKQEFIFRGIPDIVNIVISIGLALLIGTIWSLVYGLLAERIVRLILSYSMHNYRPSISFNVGEMIEFYQYGRWILIMGILGFILLQSGEFFVGVIISTAAVAIYQLAFKLATLPITGLSSIFSTVTIPTYAKIQQDQKASSRTFELSLYTLLTICVIYISLMYPLTPIFINMILGSEWQTMSIHLRYLLPATLLLTAIFNIEPIFIARGLQKKLVRWQGLAALLFLVCVTPMMRSYGLQGLIWTVLFALFINALLYYTELTRLLHIGTTNLIKSSLQLLILGVLMGLIITSLLDVIIVTNALILIAYGIGGLFISLSILVGLHLTVGFHPVSVLEEMINSKLSIKT